MFRHFQVKYFYGFEDFELVDLAQANLIGGKLLQQSDLRPVL